MRDPLIFVNCRDRVRDLRKLVAWLERAGHERLVLLDNDSAFDPLLEYLAECPHEVRRLGRNVGARALWDAGMVPDELFVYTDPDVIPHEDCPLDAVARLAELLERYPQYPKAALGMYLGDVPDGTDGLVVARSFYEADKELEPGVYGAVADTTLALYRPGSEFSLAAVLTGQPYLLRHPSWYVREPDEEDRFYLARASTAPGRGSMWKGWAREDVPSDTPLAHFYHAWCHGEWQQPLREHFTTLNECGFDGPLFVGLVGSKTERDAVADVIHREFGRKFGAILADEGFEQVTLEAVWRYCQEHDGAVMYAHTKGAYRQHETQAVWRALMTREIIGNWREHLPRLDGADAVGWHWTDWGPDKSKRFFAGNYWLARCDYLRGLPSPLGFDGRSMAELWLGMGTPRVVNVVSLLPDGSVPKLSWRSFAEDAKPETAEPRKVRFLSKPTVSVIVPTVTGREEWLERCLRGYQERTDANAEVIVVKNRPTCGVAWQVGVERATGEFIHLTADDIVPGEGWFEPMYEAVKAGGVPCAAVLRADEEVVDDQGYPLSGNPIPTVEKPIPTAFLFNRDSHPDDVPDWYESAWDLSEHPSVPFCSREQWWDIGPMICPQYGGDKWFGYRAREAGIKIIARTGTVFYHYHSPVQREPREDGWLWSDRMDFDLCIAFPLYMSGALETYEFHPQWNTKVGRDTARAWRRCCTPPPYPWQEGWERRFELAAVR